MSARGRSIGYRKRLIEEHKRKMMEHPIPTELDDDIATAILARLRDDYNPRVLALLREKIAPSLPSPQTEPPPLGFTCPICSAFVATADKSFNQHMKLDHTEWLKRAERMLLYMGVKGLIKLIKEGVDG